MSTLMMHFRALRYCGNALDLSFSLAVQQYPFGNGLKEHCGSLSKIRADVKESIYNLTLTWRDLQI